MSPETRRASTERINAILFRFLNALVSTRSYVYGWIISVGKNVYGSLAHAIFFFIKVLLTASF